MSSSARSASADIARIEAGRLTISLEPVLVSQVVGTALDLVRPQAATRRVEVLATELEEAYVTADRQRLQQVLLNLLSNAIKYHREGGIVRVACGAGPAAAQRQRHRGGHRARVGAGCSGPSTGWRPSRPRLKAPAWAWSCLTISSRPWGAR